MQYDNNLHQIYEYRIFPNGYTSLRIHGNRKTLYLYVLFITLYLCIEGLFIYEIN